MRLRAEYAFTQLGLHKLVSSYFEGNAASAGAQRRCGYREVARLRDELYREGRWHDRIVTELLRDEWVAARQSGEAGFSEG
jgi:RimJ/RimL family protein N-acetyltransferase